MRRSWPLALVAAVVLLIVGPCPPAGATPHDIVFDPDPAAPGDPVTASITVPVIDTPTTEPPVIDTPVAFVISSESCGLSFDGNPVSTTCQDLGGGEHQALIIVPEDASRGSHDVTGDIDGISATGTLGVLRDTVAPPPNPPPVTVAPPPTSRPAVVPAPGPGGPPIGRGGPPRAVTAPPLLPGPGGAPTATGVPAVTSVPAVTGVPTVTGAPTTTGNSAPPAPGGVSLGGLLTVLLVTGGLLWPVLRRRLRRRLRTSGPAPVGPSTAPLPVVGAPTSAPEAGHDPLQGRLRLRTRNDTTSSLQLLDATDATRTGLTVRARPDLHGRPDVVEVPR